MRKKKRRERNREENTERVTDKDQVSSLMESSERILVISTDPMLDPGALELSRIHRKLGHKTQETLQKAVSGRQVTSPKISPPATAWKSVVAYDQVSCVCSAVPMFQDPRGRESERAREKKGQTAYLDLVFGVLEEHLHVRGLLAEFKSLDFFVINILGVSLGFFSLENFEWLFFDFYFFTYRRVLRLLELFFPLVI